MIVLGLDVCNKLFVLIQFSPAGHIKDFTLKEALDHNISSIKLQVRYIFMD